MSSLTAIESKNWKYCKHQTLDCSQTMRTYVSVSDVK